MKQVILQQQDFAIADAMASLEGLGGGAVASFTGLVRGGNDLIELMLEHHPTMTLRQMQAIAAEAEARWPLLGLILIHRYGALAVGDRIVFVGTASPHRSAALDACHYLIDRLKTLAPFWKRERFSDERTQWVEARPADEDAAMRWSAARERW